jgi:hypothetical protein
MLSEICGLNRDNYCFLSEKRVQISDRMPNLKTKISNLIRQDAAGRVWGACDFAHLSGRDSVDKALQRLVAAGTLRRIDRGMYDMPRLETRTRRQKAPDYRAVVEAIARRGQLRLLIDGLTAANDLGLTDEVPFRVTIHTDARRKSIELDKLTIEFKQTAPSRLCWAGRPAMRLVQALHWLREVQATEDQGIRRKLAAVVADPIQGHAVREDLLAGFSTLPIWMQEIVRELLACAPVVANDYAFEGASPGTPRRATEANGAGRHKHPPAVIAKSRVRSRISPNGMF